MSTGACVTSIYTFSLTNYWTKIRASISTWFAFKQGNYISSSMYNNASRMSQLCRKLTLHHVLMGRSQPHSHIYYRSIRNQMVSMKFSSSFLRHAPTFLVNTGYGDFCFTPLSHSSIAISVGCQIPHTHSKSATYHKTREAGFLF